jgi:hypothetical protein
MAQFVDLDSLVVHREDAIHASINLKRRLGVVVRVGDRAGTEGLFEKAVVSVFE